ncbi:MAG: hypothetical protein II699_05800 [Lachnospiraceae bacterium]|nr:hypothetical protein [Lachnospiraceae bacterium]
MAGNRNYKRRRKPAGKHYRINLATIIAMVIFAYFIARFAMTITKPKISTYEVTAQKIYDTITTKALAIRDEHVVSTDQAGYIIYYVADGERVGVNSGVYAVDLSGSVYSQVSGKDNDISISDDDYINIKNVIKDYKNSYKDSAYGSVYDFKYSLDNNIMEIVNDSVIKKINDLSSDDSFTNSLNKVVANDTGVISYCYDGMEGLNIDSITSDSFKHMDTAMKQIRSTDQYKAGSPVYRIINSENWQLVLELSKDQYERIKNEKFLTVNFLKDGLTAERAASFFEKNGSYFVSLDFNKYMERYMDDRYLDVEVVINSVSGLKVPNSSIVEEELYAIPMEYSTMADEAISGVTFSKITTDDKGKETTTVIAPNICYVDEKNKLYYVSKVDLSAGDQLVLAPPEDKEETAISGEIYTISKKDKFKGVYLINRGFTQFIVINSLYETDDFCIAEDKTLYGISEYDHIVLNHNSIGEGQSIY